MKKFESVLAPLFDDYLAHKRSLGNVFSDPYHLYQFDKFYQDNSFTEIALTKESLEKWSQVKPNETRISAYQRINNIRNFSVYLNHCGYDAYVPRLPKNYNSTFTPHIFTQDEVKRFLSACDARKEKRNYFQISHYIYTAIFPYFMEQVCVLARHYRSVRKILT